MKKAQNSNNIVSIFSLQDQSEDFYARSFQNVLNAFLLFCQ